MGECFSMILTCFGADRNRREGSNGRQRKKNDDQLQRMEQGTTSNPGRFMKHKVYKNKNASPQKRSAAQHEIRSRERNPTTTVGRSNKSPNRRRPVPDDEEILIESEYAGWSSEPSIGITDEERRRNNKVVNGSSGIIQGKSPKGESSLTDVKPHKSQLTRHNPRSATQTAYVSRSEKSLPEKSSNNNGINAKQTSADRKKILQYLEDSRNGQAKGGAREKEVNIQCEIQAKDSGIKPIPSGVDAMLHKSREHVKTYQSKSTDVDVFGGKMMASAAPGYQKATDPVTTSQASATYIDHLSGKMTAAAVGPDRSTEFAASKPEKITEGPQPNKSYQGMVELQTAAQRNSDKCLASSEFSDQIFGNHKSTNLENRRANKLEDKIQQQQINSNSNWQQITIEEKSTQDDQSIINNENSMGIRETGKTPQQDLQNISTNCQNNYLMPSKESLLKLNEDRNREDGKPRRLDEITDIEVAEHSRKLNLWENDIQNPEITNEENMGEEESRRHERIARIEIAEDTSNKTVTSQMSIDDKIDGRENQNRRSESDEADNPIILQGNGRAIEEELYIHQEIQSKVSGIIPNDTKTSKASGMDAVLHISREAVKTDQSKSTDVRGGKMMASAAPTYQKATESFTIRQATATYIYPFSGKMTATAAGPDRSTQFAAAKPEKSEGPQSNQSYQGMVELQTEETSDKTVTSSMNVISNTNDGRDNKKRRSDYEEVDNQPKKFHRDTTGIQLMSSTKDEHVYQDTVTQTEDKLVANQGPMQAVLQHHEKEQPLALQKHPGVASENVQKLSEKELTIFEKINKLFEESRKFEKLAKDFVGTAGTQEHYYIDESLARLLLDLDDLGVLKNETLKLERRKVIKYIYHLLDILEERATTV